MGFADKYIVPQFSTKDWNTIVNNYQKQQVEAEGEYLKKELELDTIDQALQNFNPSTEGNKENTNDINYYKEFNNYKQNLLNLKNIVDKYGALSVDRKWLYQLSKDYNNNIRPIITAIENKKSRQNKISELEEKGYRVYNDLSSINDYINMDNNSLHYYNINDYITAGKNIMKNYNNAQSPSYIVEDIGFPGYKKLIISQGLSNMPTEGDADYDKLRSEAENYVQSHGVTSGSNLYEALVRDVMDGMSEGLTTPKHSIVDDAMYIANARKAQGEHEARKLKEDAFTGMFIRVPTYYDNKGVEYKGTEEELKTSTDVVYNAYFDELANLKSTINENAAAYLTDKAKEEYDNLSSDEDINKFLLEEGNYISGSKTQRNADALKQLQRVKDLKKKQENISKGHYYDTNGNMYTLGDKVSKVAGEGMAGSLGVRTSTTDDGKTQETYTMDNNFYDFATIEDHNVDNIKARIKNEIREWLDKKWKSNIEMPEIDILREGNDYMIRLIYNSNTNDDDKKLQRSVISHALLNIKYTK